MTPKTWALWVDGWNESQGGKPDDTPTAEEFADLVARYG